MAVINNVEILLDSIHAYLYSYYVKNMNNLSSIAECYLSIIKLKKCYTSLQTVLFSI